MKLDAVFKEYESKYPKIAEEMKKGTCPEGESSLRGLERYKNVTELMKAKPELKMKEFSKQYARSSAELSGVLGRSFLLSAEVRDALLEMGFDPTKDKAAPKLSDEQVVECLKPQQKVCAESLT